jgi:antitoxin MazE
MRTSIQKWGNSLAVRIPKPFAEEIDVTDGSEVEITVDDGALVIAPLRAPRYALHELLEHVTEDNLHGEVDADVAVGGEAW